MSGLQKSSSSRPQSGVVLVKDIPRGLSGEVVSQYFFSRGGEMKTFQMDANKRSALVEFEDTSVVSGILSAQHKIGRHVLVVTMASDMEQTKLSKKGAEMTDRVLVRGISDVTTTSCDIQQYLSSVTNGAQCIAVQIHGNQATALFDQRIDVHSLQQTCGKFPNNPEATITALDLPTHVLMKNLPSSTQDSAVRYYAENLGAEVERVHLLPSNQAVVQFNSYNSVQAIMKQQEPTLGGVHISIEEYYPEVDVSHEHSDMRSNQVSEEFITKESIEFKLPEWRALSLSRQELQDIETSASACGVKIVPPSGESSISAVEVIGSHSAVRQIAQSLKDIKPQIHMSTTTLGYTPGLWGVLKSMEDKVRLMEQDYKAAVDIDTKYSNKNEDFTDNPHQVAFTVAVKECTIDVCFGNFSCHSSADTIVNVMVHDIDQQYLNALVQSGGKRMHEDIIGRMNELSDCALPQVFETKPRNLKVKKLIHCVVLKWNGGKENEMYILKEALSHAINSCTLPCVVISPATVQPLRYPPAAMAEALIDAIYHIKGKYQATEIRFVLYVVDIDEAKAVEKFFKKKSIVIHTKDAYQQLSSCKPSSQKSTTVSVKILTSKFSALICVTKGDILRQKVDAYINSTNPDLNLSRGSLSRQILQLAGQSLQDECNEYAPLSAGQVAVTSAKNMLCQVLLHVALPKYKSKGSERVLRETMRNVLKVCLDKGVSSIAIPSLGAGNLGYPHHVVADVMFNEVRIFNSQHPSFFKEIIFILTERKVYESFMKVYAQQLCDSSTKEVDSVQTQDRFSTRLYIKHCCIEEQDVDLIVNPTTHDIDLSSNQVSQAISKKAGPQLQAICSQLNESSFVVSEENSVFTKASGQLRCKKILHVYMPKKSSSQTDGDVKSVVYTAMLNTLHKAEKERCKSLSVPLLGFGYAVEERAIAIIEASLKFGQSVPKFVREIRLVVFDKSHYEKVCICYATFKAKYHGVSSSTVAEAQENVLDVQPRSRMMSKHRESSQPWKRTDLKALENSSAVVAVYSIHPEHCEWIVQHIEGKLKEELTTQCISDVYIQQLIDSEISDIQSNISELGVTIKIDREKKQVTLSGEKHKVREAQTEITKILSSVRHANMMLKQVVWKRTGESVILQYPAEVSTQLEMAMIKGECLLEVHAEDIDAVIDLNEMIEIDRRSGRTLSIQRVKSQSHIEFPISWQPQPVEDGQEKPCHMFNVAINTEEYLAAVKEFEATMFGMEYTIISLHRIQNPNEYTKHLSFLEVLKRKYAGHVHQQYLFHGTSGKSVQAIAHQGFNRIFAADANAAVFGKGVYFAACSNYSAQEKYAALDENGYQNMFICHVIVGKYTKGDKTMKVAPPLDPGKNEHLLFDTLVDNTAKPNIYVVMSDSQAYPEYLVTFKSRRK